MRLRRSSTLMHHDPYTLIVALDANGEAGGDLYMDDENSFDYQSKGAFRMRTFSWAASTLSSTAGPGTRPENENFKPRNTLERVVVVGVKQPPTSVSVTDGKGARTATFDYNAQMQLLTIRKPNVPMSSDWTIALQH